MSMAPRHIHLAVSALEATRIDYSNKIIVKKRKTSIYFSDFAQLKNLEPKEYSLYQFKNLHTKC